MGRFSQTVPSPHVRRGSTGLILVYYCPWIFPWVTLLSYNTLVISNFSQNHKKYSPIRKNFFPNSAELTMSRQTILCIIIFTVWGITPVIAASKKVIYCHNPQYTGPIKEVFEMKATKLEEDIRRRQGYALNLPRLWFQIP